jgi:hypothetical protein
VRDKPLNLKRGLKAYGYIHESNIGYFFIVKTKYHFPKYTIICVGKHHESEYVFHLAKTCLLRNSAYYMLGKNHNPPF